MVRALIGPAYIERAPFGMCAGVAKLPGAVKWVTRRERKVRVCLKNVCALVPVDFATGLGMNAGMCIERPMVPIVRGAGKALSPDDARGIADNVYDEVVVVVDLQVVHRSLEQAHYSLAPRSDSVPPGLRTSGR